MDKNLILTGFMGTGKSTVGPMVAAQLNARFADMDARIEARAGMTIPEIFATRGEPVFRRMESVICRELAEQRGLVIATGGGTLIDPNNRNALGETGLIVCLWASQEAILERLAHAEDRPLIATDDQAAQIQALLAWRAPLYRELPAHVDTTGRTAEEVAEQIIAVWRQWQAEQA